MNKAAQALGRLARGVPKNFSPAEIERRSNILAGINSRKRAKAKKRRMPNKTKNLTETMTTKEKEILLKLFFLSVTTPAEKAAVYVRYFPHCGMVTASVYRGGWKVGQHHDYWGAYFVGKSNKKSSGDILAEVELAILGK